MMSPLDRAAPIRLRKRRLREQQQRLDRLRQKNESGELTPAEHVELLKITEQIENADAERASALIELARLHNKPVSTILHEYSPEYITNAG